MAELPPPVAGETEEESTGKAMRADARRNREKLVAVAAAAFAEHGVNTSLEEIARRAGVGIGTLYRHFPTREHLVETVYRREVDLLCHASEDLARRLPPDEALAQWMQSLVGYTATKRGMSDSLRILFDADSEIFADSPSRIARALESLVAAAAAAGTIRKDVAAADVLQALFGIYSAPATPDWEARSRRIVSLIMDGLRWGATKERE